jgi:hypothetical protein
MYDVQPLLNLLCAVAVVVGPSKESEDKSVARAMENVVVSSQAMRLAVDWELVDERELGWWATSNRDWWAWQIRSRGEEMAGVPLSGDCWRYPSKEVLEEGLRLNEGYLAYLRSDALMRTYHVEWYKEAIAETERLQAVYSNLLGGLEGSLVYYRRWHIKSAMAALGKKDYYQMKLPPPVPVWRFRWVE